MTSDDDRAAGSGPLSGNAAQIGAVLACALASLVTMTIMAEKLGAPPRSLDLAIAGFVLLIVLILAWAARSPDGDTLATGGALPTAAAAWAGFGALAPFGLLVSMMSWQYELGFDGLAFVLGPLAGLVLSGVLVSPYLAGSGAHSVASFLGLRFGRTARLLAGVTSLGVALLVAAAGLAATASLAADHLVPAHAAVALAALTALVITLPGGMASASWTSLALSMLALGAILGTATAVAVVRDGPQLPQIAYGAALAAVSGLERTMLEQGLANAQSLKPFTRPFLQIGETSFIALVVSLAAGAAIAPPHLARALGATDRRAARAGTAGALVIAFLLAITLPALATYAKREIYRPVADKTTLASLPESWENPSRDGKVRIHGVSLALFEAVARATGGGAADRTAIGAALAAESQRLAADWAALTEPVRLLLVDKARATPPNEPATSWKAYREQLLPALAPLSGNKQGVLALAAIDIDPAAAIVNLPVSVGLPHVAASFFTAGLMAAALAMAAAALAAAATALSSDVLGTLSGAAPDTPPGGLGFRLSLATMAGLSAGVAAWAGPAALAGLVPVALSTAGAALFPALVLGILWKRANARGAVLGMMTGLAVAIYYCAGVVMFPVDFSETWATLSNASPAAMSKLANLSATVAAAPDEAARLATRAALEAHARGSLWSPGTANWIGVTPLASALFALPAALAVMLVVSLVTPRPNEPQRAFLDKIRKGRRERKPGALPADRY